VAEFRNPRGWDRCRTPSDPLVSVWETRVPDSCDSLLHGLSFTRSISGRLLAQLTRTEGNSGEGCSTACARPSVASSRDPVICDDHEEKGLLN
jgi:hypothetical protein